MSKSETVAVEAKKTTKQSSALNLSGTLVSDNTLEHNTHLLNERQLAKQRQGTAATKNRALVKGSQSKPYRQKGTGKARRGSVKSPLMVGGGVAFGPSPRQYGGDMNKRQVRAIFRTWFKKREADTVYFNESDLSTIVKTKEAIALLKKSSVEDAQVPLVVLTEDDANLYMAVRNVPQVRIALASDILVQELVSSDKICLTPSAVSSLNEVFKNA